MKRIHDLSELSWTLTGWAPDAWRPERRLGAVAEVGPVPASVPGSVQSALKDAGLLPDWLLGLNARLGEWVENRHWIFEATLPARLWLPGGRHRLRADGLDGRGFVYLDERLIGRFEDAYTAHGFALDAAPAAGGERRLRIVFTCPPRQAGQGEGGGRPSPGKPRSGYGWDGMPRLVQLGPWGGLTLEATDGDEIGEVRIWTSMEMRMETGNLNVRGHVGGDRARRVRCVLTERENVLHEERFSASEFQVGVSFRDIPVRLWWPNGEGAQPVYRLRVELLDADEAVLDVVERRVGFKHVAWRPCDGAPDDAEPWLCVVNGRAVPLKGVVWTPIRAHFADVPDSEYRRRLELYRELGVNTVRVWGGGLPEKPSFYELCDELGLMVWQDFPFDGTDAMAPPGEDAPAIAPLRAVAEGLVAARQHHVSLLLWCGGDGLAGPADPLVAALADVVDSLDPTRRFVPTAPGRADEALGRGPLAHPGASGVDLIEIHAGELQPLPIEAANPFWRRTAAWVDAEAFREAHGRAPRDLREYVAWSQPRQAEALASAARAALERFPRIGGQLVWFGHDGFPCAASDAIVDFWGRPKPAALALKAIWRRP